MRFLANENFPGAAVAALGASDPDVLAWAAREQRILLTFDKDFGELAQRSALPTTCGVVLLRLPMPKPVDPLDILARQFADAAKEETRYDDRTRRPYRANLVVWQQQGTQQLPLCVNVRGGQGARAWPLRGDLGSGVLFLPMA